MGLFDFAKKGWEKIFLAGSLALFAGCAYNSAYRYNPDSCAIQTTKKNTNIRLNGVPKTLEDQTREEERLQKEGYLGLERTEAHEKLISERASNLDRKVLDVIVDIIKAKILLEFYDDVDLEHQKFIDLIMAFRKAERSLRYSTLNGPAYSGYYDKKEALKALSIIHSELNKMGFSYKPTSQLKDGLRIRDDENRYLDCDTYCDIYKAVAEEIGLKLSAVDRSNPYESGGHEYLKCHLEDGTTFNWEATSGEVLSDKYYKEWIPDPDFSYFKKKVKENPNSDIGWDWLGGYWRENGNLDKAIECYNRAIAIKPSPNRYNALGRIYLKREDNGCENAVKYFEKAIEIETDSFNLVLYYDELTDLWKARGDLKKALECSQKAASICAGANHNNFNNELCDLLQKKREDISDRMK